MTKNRYYAKLAQAKIQKVELGELQDLEKLINEIKSDRKKVSQAGSKSRGHTTDAANEDKIIVKMQKELDIRKDRKLDMIKKANAVKLDLIDALQSMEAKMMRADKIIQGMRVVEKDLGVTVPGIKSASQDLENSYDVWQDGKDDYDFVSKIINNMKR